MPGTIVFKPVKANLNIENELFHKINPYCCALLGEQEVKGKVAKKGGINPYWDDSIVVRRNYEPYCTLRIKDKEWLGKDKIIGLVEIDLREIESQGRVTKWYNIANEGQVAGEVLLESVFHKDSTGMLKPSIYQQSYTNTTSPYQASRSGLYPEGTYSPARQNLIGLRPISQMPSEIPGHDYVHQVTHSHISHNLTSEEYSKLHSRQSQRYQPTTKVTNSREAPPSWPGYETAMKEETSSILEPNNAVEGTSGSTAGNTPERLRRNEILESNTNQPTNLKFYPSIGGVKYGPTNEGLHYRPMYDGQNQTSTQMNQKGKVTDNFEVSGLFNQGSGKNSAQIVRNNIQKLV